MNNRRTIFDHLLLLARHKGIIIWTTLLVAAAAVAYSLLTPQIWKSSASFKTDTSSSLNLPVDASALGGLLPSIMGGATGDAQSALVILRSRSLNERAIRRFNLIRYFKITEPDTLRAMDMALLKLKQKVVGTGLNEENGLVGISISTRDRQLSKAMADFYLEELDRYNREFKLTKGKRNRQFYESRVKAARASIDSLTLAVRDFQVAHKAIDIQAQTTAIIKLYSDVVSQKMIADLELDLARQNFEPDSPLLRDLTQRQSALLDKIRSIERNSSGQIKPAYIVDIDRIPALAQQYTQLMINLEIQKKVFEYLYPQYEASRIEELKDMPSLEIIDPPRLAGMRAFPRRGMLCVIATFLGFVLSLLLAYAADAVQQNRSIVRQIGAALFRGKRTPAQGNSGS